MELKEKIESLAQFQKIYPEGFHVVSLEATGFCNAKCKYCPAGNDLSRKGAFMSLETYEQILIKLLKYRFLTAKTAYHMFGLGEPMLHPDLGAFLELTSQYGLTAILSTNASIVPKDLSDTALRTVNRMFVSLPGFSQASQDRIHGFPFETIKRNIIRLKEMFPDIPFDMAYHIYQFNLDEIEPARQFCYKNGIRFVPNYAQLFDRRKCLDYVHNRIPYTELKQMSQELMLQVLEREIQNAPRDYCVYIPEHLFISVDGDVVVCTSFTKPYGEDILCGNILRDSPDEILRKKYNNSFCAECIEAGLTFVEDYDCKTYPASYYSLMRENEYLWDHFGGDKKQTATEIELMYRARFWEESHFSGDALNAVLETVKRERLTEKMIRDIVCRYARFGKGTYDRLLPHLKGILST